jgi:hypothetical protein
MENGPIGLPIKNGAFPWRTVKEPEGICLHDWVIYVGQMLGYIFQHHGTYGI